MNRVGKYVIYVGLTAFVVLFGSAGFAEDWYQYHGPHRDRISQESGWNTDWSARPPKIAWKANVGTGFSSFAVADGRVYTLGNADDVDTVWCFDTETGDVLWQHSYACELHPELYEGGPGSTPAVYDGRVYTLSKEGHFYCFDAKTGEEQWLIELQKKFGVKLPTWRFATSPLIENDWVVLEIGFFVAFDRRSGEVIWKSEDHGASYGSPIAVDLHGKRCFAGFNAYGLVIVDASNGEEVAKHRWKTNYDINAATPIFADGRFFLSSGYGVGGGLIVLDAEGNTSEVWHNRRMRNQLNASVLWDGFLYGFDETNLRCVDVKTGEEQWMKSGLGRASLMIADQKLLILSEAGDLVLAEINPSEYKEISRFTVLSGKCWTIPVLANGKIYCRNSAGDVVCVDVSA